MPWFRKTPFRLTALALVIAASGHEAAAWPETDEETVYVKAFSRTAATFR
jgi:hypothetical protein